jgi:DNA-binding protein
MKKRVTVWRAVVVNYQLQKMCTVDEIGNRVIMKARG